MEKVIYTGNIPQCPHCKKPTKRAEGHMTSTLLSYTKLFDDNGNDISFDPNSTFAEYKCLDCGKDYRVKYKNGESEYE